MNDQEELPLEPEQLDGEDPGPDIAQTGLDSASDSSLLHSFTRLILGGALEGWDQLSNRLQAWEDEARTVQESQADEPSLIVIDNAPERPESASAQMQSAQALPVESQTKIVRLAMMGLLFRAESRMVRRRARALNLANETTTAVLKPLANWAGKQKRLKPGLNRFDALVRRGELVGRGWIDRGRIEDARSRQLVRTAAQDSFSDTMEELGQAPALQDLVRKQSAGLTQEALDEARVRTVGGDYLVEHFIRSLLRRIPRSQLPPPLVEDDIQDSDDSREEQL